MAEVQVIASAGLQLLGGCEGGTTIVSVEPGTSVGSLLNRFGIRAEEVGLIVLNDKKVGKEALLCGGETLKLYPFFGGG